VFFLLTAVALAGDAVSFSGVVKKVSTGKNKVGLKIRILKMLHRYRERQNPTGWIKNTRELETER